MLFILSEIFKQKASPFQRMETFFILCIISDSLTSFGLFGGCKTPPGSKITFCEFEQCLAAQLEFEPKFVKLLLFGWGTSWVTALCCDLWLMYFKFCTKLVTVWKASVLVKIQLLSFNPAVTGWNKQLQTDAEKHKHVFFLKKQVLDSAEESKDLFYTKWNITTVKNQVLFDVKMMNL